MTIARLVRLSWVTAVVVLAGCGSVDHSGAGSGGSLTSSAGKLQLAAAAIGSPFMAVAGAPDTFPLPPMRYVLDRPLASLGASATVWRMTAHTLSASDVRHFGAELGLTAAVTRTPTGWQVNDANSSLTFLVNDSAVGVSYSLGVANVTGVTGVAGGSGGAAGLNPVGGAVPASAPGAPGGSTAAPLAPTPIAGGASPTLAPPVDVPSADQAQNTARALLDRLGVLAGQQWSTDVNDGGAIAVACSVGQPCPTNAAQVFARTVTFSLMLDGMGVGGVDWSVTIGEHGRIESLDGKWATPVPDGSYPLLATDAAFGELQRGDAHYVGGQPMMAYAAPLADIPAGAGSAGPPSPASIVIHITAVSVGLARWDGYLHGSPTVNLVPTYRFRATGDQTPSYDIEVLALSPNTVTFSPAPKPPVAPQPAQPAPSSLPRPIPVPRLPSS